MDVDDILPDEYPFSFINGPLSLITLASTELSLIFWREKISNRGNTAISSVLQKKFSCDEFFMVPSSIKDIIDRRISSMGDDLQNYIAFCSKLDKNIRSNFLTGFDDIVCDPNGRISVRKTATKMLERDLDFKLKYQIACHLYLEDEVDRMFPSIWEDSPVFRFRSDEKTKAPFYWYCRMMETPWEDKVTRESRVLEAYRKRNWSALQYHWSTLDEDQYIPMALEVFKYNNTDAILCILPKLNEYQAQRVFEEKCWEILSILLSNHDYVDHVLALWNRMVNVVSAEVFVRLIRGLWRLTWITSKADCMGKYKIDGLLTEIWTTAPDRFKSYVLNHSAEFFDQLPSVCSGFVGNYGRDMEFFFDLLRNNSAEFRRTVWLNNWKKIVIRAKPSDSKKFLELCLPDEKSINDFKSRDLLNYKHFYRLLIQHGLYSDMGEYFNYCSETIAISKEISKQMLTNYAGLVVSNLLAGNNFENFNSFVDELFSDAESSAEFKQFVFWSPRSEKSLFGMFTNGRSSVCQQIMNRFATSEEHLRELKAEFLDRSRKLVTGSQRQWFDFKIWQELIEWCTVNEEEIAAFKKSLNIDEIFETFFNLDSSDWWDGNQRLTWYSKLLRSFDNFSDWYFADERAKKDFKLSKINNYKNERIVRKIFEEESRRIILHTLNWAFNNDSKMVLRFQKRLVEEKVLTSVINADEFDD